MFCATTTISAVDVVYVTISSANSIPPERVVQGVDKFCQVDSPRKAQKRTFARHGESVRFVV